MRERTPEPKLHCKEGSPEWWRPSTPPTLAMLTSCLVHCLTPLPVFAYQCRPWNITWADMTITFNRSSSNTGIDEGP
ncbi:hypothetical protein ACRALDRAFT_2032690, partial [Sodiomyces alcalophilus JCM 7366]|uniref:uncharacterized protein n=1 Tax=Sodiomyces alcalophilus JCM 7366 TaxID=591952 RepID=UPI0039B650B4